MMFYRERGFKLSIDTSGGMDLPAEEIFSLKPDYIKLDRTLFTDVEGQEYKRDLVQSMFRLAERLGCVVLGKNVETEDEAIRLLEWGVSHQQGYYYTKDKSTSEKDPVRVFQQKVEEINRCYRARKQTSVAAKRKRYDNFHKVLNKAAAKLAASPEAGFSDQCERLVASEESLVCAYMLNDDGVQITPCHFKCSLKVEAPLLGPECGRGEDHGIREDVLHLKSGLDKFVISPAVSPHARLLVSTISTRFHNAEGAPYILCLEFLCE